MSSPESFMSGTQKITTKVFRPSGPANGGVVIIAYGSEGLTDDLHGTWKTMIEGYADDLTKKGFVVSVPDYFARTNTTPPVSPELILPNRPAWQATLADAVIHAKKLADVDGSRIGLLGFSLGGHLCLRLRASAKVLVEFFAPRFDGIGSSDSLTLHTQIHHGAADQLVLYELNGKKIFDELRASYPSTTTEFVYKGANHGFIGTDPDNTKARDDSKARTIAFFEAQL
ncbi:MAG TPA: dienelactone hydrolase family protein [Bradyrhizobium sp.]|jgi:dienelactone hydrolase|nr:dienelactone hydrolase family protein [Bradyrhizobium sp.]